MRVTVKDGRVIAEAETVADINALAVYMREPKAQRNGVAKGYKHRQKTCRACGKQYRYRKAHGRSCNAGETDIPVRRIIGIGS